MKEKILAIVKEAVIELNEDLDYDSLEDPSEETPLYDGSDESIDSLSLVALVTDIEKRLKKELGQEVILADEEAMNMEQSPYRNLGALAEFALSRT